MSDKPKVKIGVYVCHCGGNISDVVDVERVAQEVARAEGIEVATHYAFMCSDPGQKLIVEDLASGKIDRAVVAACSPALHELTFRKALERAGVNPYLYEHVNIREQVSWVHKQDIAAATAKAIRLTLAGAAKVALAEPLEAIQVPSEKRALVLGGGVAGMSAALSVARSGVAVTLLEKADRLGGRTLELGRLYPTEEPASNLVSTMVESIRENPLIDVQLGAEVVGVDGYVGNFEVRWRRTSESSSIEPYVTKAGAIILATGFDHYRPHEGELGYGASPQVLTLPEFNALLADAPSGSPLTVGGKAVRRVAFVHCVGSRQVDGVHEPGPDGKVNDYCSRVCCTAALHSIHQLLDRFPDVKVFDLYKDIRTYGRGHEDLYERASKRGVLFLRMKDDAVPAFSNGSAGGLGGTLTIEDVLTWNEEVSVEADLVVLATGMVPRDLSTIVSSMKLPIGADRFLQEVHPKLRPVEVANNGVFLAGACQGPMDIGESVAAAQAAAAKALILLSQEQITLDPFVAKVDPLKCTGCGDCLPECEYKGALLMPEKTAVVNPALCVGCGACAAVCPTRAISVAGWTLDQFDAMVDALAAEPAGVGR